MVRFRVIDMGLGKCFWLESGLRIGLHEYPKRVKVRIRIKLTDRMF